MAPTPKYCQCFGWNPIVGFPFRPMQTFHSPDYLPLTYRSGLDFLVGRWLMPVSGAETRQGYALILQAARQCNCPYWLLDGRRRPATSRRADVLMRRRPPNPVRVRKLSAAYLIQFAE